MAVRVAVDATCWWNRRGFGRFTRGILRALVRRQGDGLEYVLLVDRDPRPDELPEGCVVENAAPSRTVADSAVAGARRSLGDLRAFTRAVRRLRPDLFFFPAVYSYFPLPWRTRAVVCLHDTIAESFPELVFPDARSRLSWRLKTRAALFQATRVMTVSEASRRALMDHFGLPESRIDVVTEGADPWFRSIPEAKAALRWRERLGIPQDVPYLLYVGGISPHKNLKTLLQALARLDRQRAVFLVMVGDREADGFLANFAELHREVSASAALESRCRFTGFVSDDELVELYNGSYALVLPSLCEGFGLPALEAMSCGTPVLASNTGSLPEVVGPAGLTFDPRDAGDIHERIMQILLGPELRDELAARARPQSTRFSWERGAQLVLESFKRALA